MCQCGGQTCQGLPDLLKIESDSKCWLPRVFSWMAFTLNVMHEACGLLLSYRGSCGEDLQMG